jgi:hypothetical protein
VIGNICAVLLVAGACLWVLLLVLGGDNNE